MKTQKLAIGYIHEGRAAGYDDQGTCTYQGSDRMMPPCRQIIEGEVARQILKALDRWRSPTDGRQGNLW